jgi:uncharacterized membrane protein
MPDIGVYHPQIVHFVIGLLVVGVVLRWVSLTGRATFAGAAAATLILLGSAAAVLAAKSGTDAHDEVEKVPGSARAVKDHEDWGEWTRDAFLAVAAAELLALYLSRRGKAQPALFASALLGLGGLFCLYEAGEHGGKLVYSYAGGVGIRSGEPEDVGRLLLAGLYHQAQLDRKAGKPADAALLLETAVRRFPSDAAVQLAAAESLLSDRHDAAAALEALGKITPAEADRRLRFRLGWLTADALETLGRADSARAALEKLASEFPQSERLKRRLASPAP